MTINEKDAISIDNSERALLSTAYPAIREALTKHLENVSKKSLEKAKGQEIATIKHGYRVDGEVGRFYFTTHRLTIQGRLTIPLQIFSERVKGKNGIELLGSMKLPLFLEMWYLRIEKLPQ